MNPPRTIVVALVAMLIAGSTSADTSTLAASAPGSLAFARYIASIHRRDPFRESGPVEMLIEASLPGLHRQSRLVAIRDTGESERSEYTVIESEGDAMVTQEVIEPYLAEQKAIEDLPLSSVIATPANYRFHLIGGAGIGGSPAYVFQIAPKRKREGLMRGELWLDSETGLPVMQAGSFVKTASREIRRMEMVRNMKLQNGSPSSRITHVSIETRRFGRGYLAITEFPPAAIGASPLAGE